MKAESSLRKMPTCTYVRGMSSPAHFTLTALVIALTLLAWSAIEVHAQGHRGEWKPCEDGAPDERIAACTRIIQNARIDKKELGLAYSFRGIAHFRKNEFDAAIEDFSRAIELDPTQSYLFGVRGQAYLNRAACPNCDHYLDLALADFERVIALDPRSSHGYWGRGQVLMSRGIFKKDQSAWSEFFATMERCLANAKDKAVCLSLRASARVVRGESALALPDYDRLIDLEPTAQHYRERGYALMNAGEPDRALKDYDRSLELDPNDNVSYGQRADAHFRKENYDQAIADANRALAGDPSWSYPADTLHKAQDAKAALLARAQSAPTGARVALIIGNAHYLNSPPLPNAANDAEDISKALQGIGFKVYGYPRTDFLKLQMQSEIDAFKRVAEGASVAVVWYAGHGKTMTDEARREPQDWLIPVDARINKAADVANNAIQLDLLKIAVLPAKGLRLVVIDACRDNTFYDGTRGSRGLDRGTPNSGVLLVYSTETGKLAQDGDGRNSPFAQAFLETVRAKPKLDVRQLFSAVTGRTRELTHDQQRPEQISGLTTPDTLALAQ